MIIVRWPDRARATASASVERSSRIPAVSTGVHNQIWRPVTSTDMISSMNFAFTEEQEELRNFVRSFMEDKSSEAAVREQMETENGYDAGRVEPDGRADGSPGDPHP